MIVGLTMTIFDIYPKNKIYKKYILNLYTIQKEYRNSPQSCARKYDFSFFFTTEPSRRTQDN